MVNFGRKTLKSKRAQMRNVDHAFEIFAQFLIISCFVFTLVTWVTMRESLRIDSIAVYGAHATKVADIEALTRNFLSQKILWKIYRDNALLYPEDALANALRSLDSHVKDIQTIVEHKKFLAIHVTEYTPKYLWCDDTEKEASTTRTCYLADDAGYVFAKAPDYSGYPFDIFETSIAGSEEQESPIGLHVLPEEEFSKLIAFRLALEKAGFTTYRIAQTGEYEYALTTDAPWIILWSSQKEPTSSVENLVLVLNDLKTHKGGTTTPTSIDLRFGSKIFYR